MEPRRKKTNRPGSWTEDLLRVFAPWAEGTAGPDLPVCLLAGSILTLRHTVGRKSSDRSKVRGHRKVRKTHIKGRRGGRRRRRGSEERSEVS